MSAMGVLRPSGLVKSLARTSIDAWRGNGKIAVRSRSSHTHNMTEPFLSALAEWAARESEMLAVAVVGSHARGAARADSDVDLVLLVANPERYFVSADWIKHFGEICSFRDEDWGRLRSRRVYYASGLEVEFGFSDAAWASTDPVDPGTKTVVTGGLLCVYDPQNILRLLAAAVKSH